MENYCNLEIYKLTDTFTDFKYLAWDMHNQLQNVVLENPIRMSQNSFLFFKNTLHFETGKGYINFDIKKEEDSYYIEIIDLIVSNKGKWHGTILMDALFVLIQNMEEKLGMNIPIIFGELSSADNKAYNINFYHDYLSVKNAQINSDYVIVYDAYQCIGPNKYAPNKLEVDYCEGIQSLYLVQGFKYIKK